ncbi:MAG TPA: HNH endonuclease signature motif containing protein [Vicinamibacterales bacterium]
MADRFALISELGAFESKLRRRGDDRAATLVHDALYALVEGAMALAYDDGRRSIHALDTLRAKARQLRRAILERDGYRCQICGVPVVEDDVEIDHVVPLSRGGDSSPANLQAACARCNRRKSNHVAGDGDG